MADSENVKHVVSSLIHNTHAPIYTVSVDAYSCVTEECNNSQRRLQNHFTLDLVWVKLCTQEEPH